MTFDSVYEMFDLLTTVRKQRFWEWFSGNNLKSYWITNNLVGVSTFAMADDIDQGFSITTSISSTAKGSISFNDKRQYDPTASVCIVVARRVTNTGSLGFAIGLSNTNDTGSAINFAAHSDIITDTFKSVTTADGTTTSRIQGSIPVDAAFHALKFELLPSSLKWSVDGVVQTDKTSNLPTVKLQPLFKMNSVSQVSECRIRYFEAFNT